MHSLRSGPAGPDIACPRYGPTSCWAAADAFEPTQRPDMKEKFGRKFTLGRTFRLRVPNAERGRAILFVGQRFDHLTTLSRGKRPHNHNLFHVPKPLTGDNSCKNFKSTSRGCQGPLTRLHQADCQARPKRAEALPLTVSYEAVQPPG